MRDDKEERPFELGKTASLRKFVVVPPSNPYLPFSLRFFSALEQTHESRTNNKSRKWLLENIRAEEKTRKKIRRTL